MGRSRRGASPLPDPPHLLNRDDRKLVGRQDCTSLAFTVVAEELSVNATLSMFAGLLALSVYATADTV
jgi:hypothetical protein